ncbi:MAG TPA: alpha-amylase, partial [Actinomycetes bacterium]|nr:alpha-amylase [Actinomycetes bacterium]
ADPRRVDTAIRRLLLAHYVVLGFGGLPLLYMGDEIALLNDYSYADDPEHAGDNRWVHRPRMPWELVERREVPGTVEHRVWSALRHAVRVRSELVAMHAGVEPDLLEPVNSAVFAVQRRHPASTLVGLYNVTEHHQWWPRWAVPIEGELHDELRGGPAPGDVNGLRLGPYDALWLTAR